MNFAKRSYKQELLDRDDIPFEDIRRNMYELNFINTHLGGHAITIRGLKNLLQKDTSIHVCEIGCGGGDNLQAIEKWLMRKKIIAKLTGIDINESCIAVARAGHQKNHSNFEFITSDYRLVHFGDKKPDIIFSSLFCHHFSDTELISMLKWMHANCTTGFFINDLHRNLLAYYSISILTTIFSKSYLVKNDAPLSVLRGFSRREWQQLLENAGITQYSIQWKWAFRWLITVKPNKA